MKLGIDVRPLAYGITGNSRYLAEVLNRMIPHHPTTSFYFFSNKKIHPVFSELEKHKNVILVIENRPIPGPIYIHCLLPTRLKANGIDRFWGTLQMLPFWKLQIPSFVNYHDLNFISAPNTMARWNLWQHKLFSPRTIRNADKIFCLSRNTENEILRYFPIAQKKTLVVYPGVNKRKFKIVKGILPKSFYLTIGTLEPRKNIQTLIDAFLLFKLENPQNKHKLVILGRKGWGLEGDKLYEFLTGPEAEKNMIVFLENPNDDLLGQAIHECEIFFFPSLHEGFGLPLLEAMIEDKRCVASSIPVFKEILEDKNDLYIKADDLTEWKEAFVKVSKFKTKQRSPKFKEKQWSWDETTKLLEEVILQ